MHAGPEPSGRGTELRTVRAARESATVFCSRGIHLMDRPGNCERNSPPRQALAGLGGLGLKLVAGHVVGEKGDLPSDEEPVLVLVRDEEDRQELLLVHRVVGLVLVEDAREKSARAVVLHDDAGDAELVGVDVDAGGKGGVELDQHRGVE
jgi:hypothetical protein